MSEPPPTPTPPPTPPPPSEPELFKISHAGVKRPVPPEQVNLLNQLATKLREMREKSPEDPKSPKVAVAPEPPPLCTVLDNMGEPRWIIVNCNGQPSLKIMDIDGKLLSIDLGTVGQPHGIILDTSGQRPPPPPAPPPPPPPMGSQPLHIPRKDASNQGATDDPNATSVDGKPKKERPKKTPLQLALEGAMETIRSKSADSVLTSPRSSAAAAKSDEPDETAGPVWKGLRSAAARPKVNEVQKEEGLTELQKATLKVKNKARSQSAEEPRRRQDPSAKPEPPPKPPKPPKPEPKPPTASEQAAASPPKSDGTPPPLPPKLKDKRGLKDSNVK